MAKKTEAADFGRLYVPCSNKVLCKQRGGSNPPIPTNNINMKNTKHAGTLILKYHGETYQSHEKRLPIEVTFNPEMELSFDFSFPESPTKEKVVFKQTGNINPKAVMEPYGIEIVIPNDNTFFVQFLMVELTDDDDAENFTAVAKFDVPFAADKNQNSIYSF